MDDVKAYLRDVKRKSNRSMGVLNGYRALRFRCGIRNKLYTSKHVCYNLDSGQTVYEWRKVVNLKPIRTAIVKNRVSERSGIPNWIIIVNSMHSNYA